MRDFVADAPGLDARRLLRDAAGLEALVTIARRECRYIRGTGESGLDALAGEGLDALPPDAPATAADPAGLDAPALQKAYESQNSLDQTGYRVERMLVHLQRRHEACGADIWRVLEEADTWLSEEEVRQALDAQGCCWGDEAVRETLYWLVHHEFDLTYLPGRGYGPYPWEWEKRRAAEETRTALDRARLGLPQPAG